MVHAYPAGSEWRKWDLHVHVPGTKLTDGYEKKDGEADFDRFAEILEQSDVAVFGITDYFSADQTIAFIKFFKEKYPESKKLLLVNVEVRLNETVNRDLQIVDFHFVFRDTVSEEKITEFLSKLSTETTDAHGRHKACSELVGKEYDQATVTRTSIKKAFKETFGDKAEPTDFLIYIVPANNNGFRAESGKQRKAILADEIDKHSHAIFGKGVENSAHFLKTDRFEDSSQRSVPKPVFGGSDAHNFTDLENWLGKALDNKDTRQVITWVKADPTFEGLQQTLVEPEDRVSLSELKPDAKDQYKVIKRVKFEGSSDFPEEIQFNPNLNAIIGSRSSGKSALLAHIAYAIDPAYTIAQQGLASKLKEHELGPAAGRSWKSVESTICEVEWSDGSVGGGRVIYVPQNWLYQISDNPKEVTDKIRPVLESRYPAYFREQHRLLDSVKLANELIGRASEAWFELADEHEKLASDIKLVGDKVAITKARDGFKTQIEEQREANSLSAEDLETYQAVIESIAAKKARLDEIQIEVEHLNEYVVEDESSRSFSATGSVLIETRLTPEPSKLPKPLEESVKAIVAEAESKLLPKVEAALVAHRVQLAEESKLLDSEIASLQQDNKALLEKHRANKTLDELVNRQKTQQDSLDKIDALDRQRLAVVEKQGENLTVIDQQIEVRSKAFDSLTELFEQDAKVMDQLAFGIAYGIDATTVAALSEPFRKNQSGSFITKVDEADAVVDISKAQKEPATFLSDLFSKKQKLNQGNVPSEVATRVLTATPEIRFTATLDEDRIGGFERSTMTPGKQALFALTLILGEAEERWTLLIDQPEDDLDSRSIYSDIVRYLVEQKKERQIILVTHNANLVVGADAESVIVANRHGDDRKNREGRTFDYLTGSLEHSRKRKASSFELERMGIREHAVEILDGGKEAFQKRRDKYKI